MKTLRLFSAALAALTLIAGTASAHVGLKSSSIEDGASLTESPEALELTFSQPVGMMSFTLATQDGKEIETGYRPDKAKQAVFSIPLQALEPGSYAAEWRTIAKDGHVMKGSLRFDVK